jgi:hypothetical protein
VTRERKSERERERKKERKKRDIEGQPEIEEER